MNRERHQATEPNWILPDRFWGGRGIPLGANITLDPEVRLDMIRRHILTLIEIEIEVQSATVNIDGTGFERGIEFGMRLAREHLQAMREEVEAIFQ